MSPFWTYARKMMERKGLLGLAILFAFLSAAGLGIGLVGLGPMFALILDPQEGRNLVVLATEFNAQHTEIGIPDWIVSSLPADRFGGIVFLAVGLAILTVIGSVLNFLHQYLALTVTTLTVAGIRQSLFSHVIHLPLERVVQKGPSEFVARIIRDCQQLQEGFNALVSKSVAHLSKGIAAFVAACIFDVRLVLIAVIIGPVLAIVLRKLGKRIRRGTHGSLAAQQILLKQSTEVLQGLRAVKCARGEATAEHRFGEVNATVVMNELKVRTARSMSSPIVEMLAIFVLGILAVVAARNIINGTMEFDRFILALGSLGVAGGSLRPLAGLVAVVQASDAPAQRIGEILDEPVETGGTTVLPRHQVSIEFSDIHFVYPGSTEAALCGASLSVKHGQRVAIVGPNGCGKTTLLSLLPRLMNPSNGSVAIDGVDLGSVTLASLRDQIGVVTQESVIFAETVAANIQFGQAGASQKAIEHAARQAHAHEFIEQLDEGYDTVLAEHGASLSGGQRQRLVIARAILRDPSILILDEATSQIDAESESMINDTLIQFGQGRSVLVIAHRLSTVLDADVIAVMEAGTVVDSGTHEELLGRCGLYQRLVQTQLVPAQAHDA